MSSIDKKTLMTASFSPVSVSFFFAQEDYASYKALYRHLAALRRNHLIETWDEGKIPAGEDASEARKLHLSNDRLLILFISSDFIESELCLQQMEVALQRLQQGNATIIPILVRPCSWEDTPLRTLQMLPREQKPRVVSSSPEVSSLPEEVWQEIVTEIHQVIDSIHRWVFLAYAQEDRDIVERFHRDLARSDIRLWSLEHEQFYSDLSQNREMHAAMLNASIVLLITSPATAYSSAVKEQMKLAAIDKYPVLIVWARGEDHTRPDAEAWHAEGIIDARGERYEIARTILEARLKQQGQLAPTVPETVPVPLTEPRNPYKGLNPFKSEDARDFFGRDALIGELAATVKQILAEDTEDIHSARLLTVLLGASGSGKSSVVMAGLLPRLQQKGIANSPEWIYLEPMKPGNDPLGALATSLAQHPDLRSVGNVPSFTRELSSDSLRTLSRLARQLVGSSSRKVVLFIDQFEEIFAPAVSEGERKRFFDILFTAVTERQGPLLILLTLRADFYDRPMQYKDLYKLLEAHRVTVLPMELEDLRQVIAGPAKLPDVQLTFDENLVEDLLFEVHNQGASLPLLQFTLDQLFERRDDRRLTRKAYNEIGGVKGALVKHADKTYARLPSEEHRKLAQNLFIRLVEPGENLQEMTRRRVRLSELSLPDTKLARLQKETIEVFVAARLLTTNAPRDNDIAGIQTIEISHEALIREWPPCGEWIRDNHKNLQMLSRDVKQWEQEGRPKERLYYGSQLKKMKRGVEHRNLYQQEIDFLRASTAHQQQQWMRTITLLLVPALIIGLFLTPILIFRPAWCPSWLCPQAPHTTGGAYDSNLQVTFQTVQSSFKILPIDPSAYTLGTRTPNNAELISTDQSQPYRVVMEIHSLQQERYGLVIDQVALLIKQQAQIIPYPLRIIINNSLIYNNNPYRITYRGQGAGTQLIALFMGQPQGSVSLLSGETDEISLEVRSMIAVDLHFQVQVTYHVRTKLATHTLMLPNIFEVVFSDKTNWHPYQILDGQLVAVA